LILSIAGPLPFAMTSTVQPTPFTPALLPSSGTITLRSICFAEVLALALALAAALPLARADAVALALDALVALDALDEGEDAFWPVVD
jgi:hypothetical protein